MSDNTPTHYKGFTIKHNAPMTDEYYVVGSLSFYKTVDDAKRSIDGLLGNDTPTSLEAILLRLINPEAYSLRHEKLDEAIAAITALIPEKKKITEADKQDANWTDRATKAAYNNAINTIQRNFTGQTDNEREEP